MSATPHYSGNDDAPALEALGVQFSYPATRRSREKRTALAGVDLTVNAGQAVVMLGPNGSGKSTFMKIVCGLLPTDRGTVKVFGAADAMQARRAIGVVFQSACLDKHLTVEENLTDQARLYGMTRSEARQRVDEELNLADLGDRRGAQVKSLSGGLARRVDLCRALLHRPRLLLLDEPTVGLDPAARETFLDQLDQRRRDHDLTIVMNTHLVDEADRHDRVVLMDQGRIIADDGPAKLRRRLGARCVTVLDHEWRPPGPDPEQWKRVGEGWSLELEGDPGQAAAMAGQLAGSGVPFSIAPPTLADVFEHLTGHSLEDAVPPDDTAEAKP